jgi:hypothetical protein
MLSYLKDEECRGSLQNQGFAGEALNFKCAMKGVLQARQQRDPEVPRPRQPVSVAPPEQLPENFAAWNRG